MKKILLIAALTMASAPAFASKARMTALSNSAHLEDIQTSFDQPWEFAANGELAIVEFGPTSAAVASGTAKAEGGFVRQMNDSYLGAYVGRQPTALLTYANNLTFAGVTAGNTNAILFQPNNPLNLFYASKAGDIMWGVNLYYLAANVKTPSSGVVSIRDRKTSATGVSVGASNGTWNVSLSQGLPGKSEFTVVTGTPTVQPTNGTTSNIAAGTGFALTSKASTLLQGGYKMDSLYYYGVYNMSGAKAEITGGAGEIVNYDTTDLKLGVINTHKADGIDFFYGIALQQTVTKSGTPPAGTSTKTDQMALPIIVGVEADATSYLVLRGSLTQNLPILSARKVDTGNTSAAIETDSVPESVAVAGGLGLKLGKFQVDATLKTVTDGDFGLDKNGFLANTSLTYNF